MFWSRKDKNINTRIGPILVPPIPPKREFNIMLEILRDSEKYDNEGERELSKKMLLSLKEYIDEYFEKLSI
jgi:hypothetical protein